MSQIPLDNDREGQPGEPGLPGEPGIGGGGAGGAGGRGGRGGRGGEYRRRDHEKLFNLSGLLLLFVFVGTIGVLIFAFNNSQRHEQINEAEYEICIKAERIADNQERVILALISLETRETEAGRREHSSAHLNDLREALKLVPTFNCLQFKEGG